MIVLKHNNREVVATDIELLGEDSYIFAAHYSDTGEDLELGELIDLTENNIDVLLEMGEDK